MPHTIAITLDGDRYDYTLPESWAEVLPSDWKRIARWVLAGDSEYSRTRLLRLLLKYGSGNLISRSVWSKLEAAHLVHMWPMLDWVWSGDMYYPPFPHVWIGGRRYLLPNAGLEYITAIEYAMVDFHYNLYRQHAETGRSLTAAENLNKVVAYLCRPVGKISPEDAMLYKGDKRELFNQAICDARLPKFEKLPIEQKLAVVMFYAAGKKRIHRENEGILFAKENANTEVIGTRPMRAEEWVNLIFAMSGGKFGDLQQTMYTPLSNLMYELRQMKLNKRA